MEISEQELRGMIRDAIARHSGGGPGRAPLEEPAPGGGAALHVHSSHGLFLIPGSLDGDCVIEPARRCDHCGYCKSLGH